MFLEIVGSVMKYSRFAYSGPRPLLLIIINDENTILFIRMDSIFRPIMYNLFSSV